MADIPLSRAARPSHNRLALAILLAGAAAIGASPIFVRLSEVGPLATAFWRVAIAVLPFLAFQGLAPARKAAADARPSGLRDVLVLLLPGIFLASDLAAWHIALTLTSVANATLLSNLAPVFVTLASWLLFRAPITRIFLAGLAMTLVGVVVLKGGPAAMGGGDAAGDAISISAAIFYAGYILAIGHARTRFSTLRILVWSTVSTALLVLPFALLLEESLAPATLYGWAMVAGLALICHVGGQSAITYALAWLPTSFSSLTLLLQPVVAALLAWLLLGEAVGPMQAVGGAIVLAGILVARRG